MKKGIFILSLLMFWSIKGYSLANPEPGDSTRFKKYVLEKIRVIAQRPEETISSMTTIEPGADTAVISTNLKESMEGIPGISVTVGTKDESNLRIRGFRKNEVKILVDGRPLNAGYFGNIDLQNLPLSEIKEIDILKGPASSLYGSNTLGGVVNLITREPSDKKWFRLGLTARRNNTNEVELSASHSYENWNFWAYASRYNTDGFMLPADFQPTVSENGDVRNNSGKTQYNFQTRGNVEIGVANIIGFSAGVTSIGKKLIPASVYESNDFRLYKDWLRYQATLTGDFQLSSNTELASQLYLDGGQDTYQQYNDPNYHILSVDSDMRYQSWGFNHRLDWQVGANLSVSTGLHSEIQNSTRKDNGNYPTWTPHQVNLYNIFLQAKYDKYQGFKFTGSLASSIFKNDVKQNYADFFEPAVGFYYTIPGKTNISLATGINTAYPTMRQLFSSDRGNPELKPQSGLKSELTVSHPFSTHHMYGVLSFSTYQNNVQNLIDLFGERYENIYKVRSYGLEADLLIKPLKWYEFNCGYGLLKYDQISSYKLTESPQNTLDLLSVFSLPFKTKLSFRSGYSDIRLSLDSADNYKVLPAYWIHSVFLSKIFNSFNVKFGLDNITDAYYEEEYGYPAAGRGFSLKIETEF